jgi:hypothetical protein
MRVRVTAAQKLVDKTDFSKILMDHVRQRREEKRATFFKRRNRNTPILGKLQKYNANMTQRQPHATVDSLIGTLCQQ